MTRNDLRLPGDHPRACGEHTTSVTAKKLGRNYTGIEINDQYCVWAEKRLEMADSDKTIQGYADGVFWERNTAALQKKSNNSQITLQEWSKHVQS